MTNESNAGERNEPEAEKAEPTAADIAAAKLAQEIADGHRYMPQEMRDAKEAAGKPDRKGKGDKPGFKKDGAKPDFKKGDKKDGAKKADIGGGDRIAKVMARAGIASRREIERLIGLGKVAVNGRILETPAVLVKATDVITVEGRVIGKAEPTRLFRYHKPVGLVTTERDPEGRQTVFDKLPRDLPRVLKVGRLDLNSEGLLLLTNDGELARALELPNTGWVRRYRVRALGQTTQAKLDTLKNGTTIDGVLYGPIEATLDKAVDKADGRANLWLSVALTEGKNREVRKVLDSIGLKVNRLIRLAYGPFLLGNLEPGEVEEVGPRVIRELLSDMIDPRNLPPEGASQPARTPVREAEAPQGRRSGGDRFGAGRPEGRGDRPAFRSKSDGERPAKAWKPRDEMAKREFKPRDFAERPRFEGDGPNRDAAPREEGRAWTPRPERGERTREPSARFERGEGSERPRSDGGYKKPYAKREDGDRKPYGAKPYADRPKRDYAGSGGGDRSRPEGGFKKPYTPRGDIPAGEAGAYERAKREFGGDAAGEKKPWTPRPEGGDRPRPEGGYKKPYAAREGGERKSYDDRPKRDYGDRPARTEGGYKKPYTPRGEGAAGGDRPPRAEGGYKKPYTPREGGERKPYSDRPQGEGGYKKPYTPREGGDRKPYGGDRPARAEGGFKKPYTPRGEGAGGGEGKPAWKPRPEGAHSQGRPGGGFKSSGPRSGGRPAPRKPRGE